MRIMWLPQLSIETSKRCVEIYKAALILLTVGALDMGFQEETRWSLPSKIGGIVLPLSGEVKYLGVILDKQLLWNKHAKTKME